MAQQPQDIKAFLMEPVDKFERWMRECEGVDPRLHGHGDIEKRVVEIRKTAISFRADINFLYQKWGLFEAALDQLDDVINDHLIKESFRKKGGFCE